MLDLLYDLFSVWCLRASRQLLTLGESVGSGGLAIIWVQEKSECEKRDEVCGDGVSFTEQKLKGEDDYAKRGLGDYPVLRRVSCVVNGRVSLIQLFDRKELPSA